MFFAEDTLYTEAVGPCLDTVLLPGSEVALRITQIIYSIEQICLSSAIGAGNAGNRRCEVERSRAVIAELYECYFLNRVQEAVEAPKSFIFSHKFRQTVQTPFGKETYLYWYEIMLLLRRFEEKAGQLYGMQKIRGFCHLYIGQEAVAAGAMTAIRDDDNMITAYRDHGLAIAKGVSPKECMAELYGKATGCTKGKGGSMHFFTAHAVY